MGIGCSWSTYHNCATCDIALLTQCCLLCACSCQMARRSLSALTDSRYRPPELLQVPLAVPRHLYGMLETSSASPQSEYLQAWCTQSCVPTLHHRCQR
jgi:hypothetical protein